MIKRSLYFRLFLGIAMLLIIQGIALLCMVQAQADIYLWTPLITLVLMGLTAGLVQVFMQPFGQLISSLEVGVRSLKDNDFSVTIHNKHYHEFTLVIDTYNELQQVLRHERLSIFQRENLLETVIQATPVALILTNAQGRIVLSNVAAKTLLNYQKKLNGELFSQVIEGMPPGILEATLNQTDGLITESRNNEIICYSLICQQVTLANQVHSLYLYKNLTSEISRKENDIWKNAIRLISHELNNSLAPIKSLTASAKKIIEQVEHHHMLPEIFDTIGNRVQNLHKFLSQYADYARLPSPQHKAVNLIRFIANVERFSQLKVMHQALELTANFDPVQVEQVLFNLIKNAKESGSLIDNIALSITQSENALTFTLVDGGCGMTDQQLQQALLPFFTTKASGSGLGLALCNEIIIAHHGKLKLENRSAQQQGLRVTFTLPLNPRELI